MLLGMLNHHVTFFPPSRGNNPLSSPPLLTTISGPIGSSIAASIAGMDDIGRVILQFDTLGWEELYLRASVCIT